MSDDGTRGVARELTSDDVGDLAPLARRVVALDASGLVRLRRSGAHMSALVRLPFGVLAARTIALDVVGDDHDVTVRAGELLAWLDGERADPPTARDADWRGGIPPASGWHRIDTVPATDVRSLVNGGAQTLKEAAEREGLPAGPFGAKLRAEVADALLDSVVLTVTDGPRTVEVTLRTLSAVTRLGFLPRGSYVAVDVAGRWVRIAAAYGSVYAERPGVSLGLSPR